jgi:hypothetical protein
MVWQSLRSTYRDQCCPESVFKLMRVHAWVALFIAVFVRDAQADFIFEIDMNLDKPGVQSVRQAESGEQFDVGLLLTLTGTSSLAAFSMGLLFDTSELYVNSVDVSGRPLGFGQEGGIAVDNANGTVGPIKGLNLSSANDLQPGYTGYLARLNITALTPDDSPSVDLQPYFRSILDGVLKSDNFEAPFGNTPGDGGVFFYGGRLTSVTAVPEPTSLVLVTVAGVASLVRFRRFRGCRTRKG